MKDTLGSQGVQKLIQKFQEKKDRVEDAEKAGSAGRGKQIPGKL